MAPGPIQADRGFLSVGSQSAYLPPPLCVCVCVCVCVCRGQFKLIGTTGGPVADGWHNNSIGFQDGITHTFTLPDRFPDPSGNGHLP
jgi:hypothetical protein